MINFSSRIKAKKAHNPNYSIHGIELQARMLQFGGSGAGKTNLALKILKVMKNTFSKVLVGTCEIFI